MKHYDVLIVGAGIAGTAMAQGLSTITSRSRSKKSLRIGLLERSLAEPDRIVGELLQPGGVSALRQLGMEECLSGIDAIPVHGYCIIDGSETVQIPYPDGYEGRSFHHGRFIMALRRKAKQANGVEMMEASVTELLMCEHTKRVIGVHTKRTEADKVYEEAIYADLVIIADGCFSNFRTVVMGADARKPTTKSHFIGAILENAHLPIKEHGTVVLVKNSGPVLLYQISGGDTRMLIDIKSPVPADLKNHITINILPQIPRTLHAPIREALDSHRLRRMPNSFLPSTSTSSSHLEGVILLGDAWNMRHPLTGGGMTVAFNDVVLLAHLLARVPDWTDWTAMQDMLGQYWLRRKALAGTINILSVALYDLFGADDKHLAVLRKGCFKYFERGGDCIAGPVSLLSGIIPSPMLLARHFFAVAFYSIYIMFTSPMHSTGEGKAHTPRFIDYPALTLKGLRVFWTACVVFGPLVWSEIRWW